MLVASHVEGPTKTGFGLRVMRRGACQQQLSGEPMEFRFIAPLPRLFYYLQRFCEHNQPRFGLSHLSMCLRQQGELLRPSHGCPRALVGDQPLMYMDDAVFFLL